MESFTHFQLFGVDNEERQIYFRTGITNDEQTGKNWAHIDLPHVSCAPAVRRETSVASSLASSHSTEPLTIEKSQTSESLNDQSLQSVEDSSQGSLQSQTTLEMTDSFDQLDASLKDSQPLSAVNLLQSSPPISKINDSFKFKPGFAVSFKPSSGAVNMDVEDDAQINNSKHSTSTPPSENQVNSTTPYPGNAGDMTSQVSGEYDSLASGLDSLSIQQDYAENLVDGDDILWVCVSASACHITDETQIRSWLLPAKGTSLALFTP